MTLPRPPRGTTPKTFYLDYLPTLWRALIGEETDVPDVTIGVRIDDESYVTAVADGVMENSLGNDDAAVTTFVSDRESWNIALLGLLPRLLKHIEPRLAKADIPARLRALEPSVLASRPGIIVVHYEDDAGDEAKVEIHVGKGGTRRAVVKATDAEFWKLLEGGGRLSQLVTSRVRVTGDVAYLLDLARLIDG